MARVTLDALNAAFDADFVLALDGIYRARALGGGGRRAAPALCRPSPLCTRR